MSKAATLLRTTQSHEDRSSSYLASIKRNLQRDIDDLQTREEKLTDKLSVLSDFSISTNVNLGIAALTRDQTEERFKQILLVEYELILLGEEIKVKREIFDKYFLEDVISVTTKP